MARYTGPKNKLSRREGIDLFGKGSKLRKATVLPGALPGQRPKKISDYGRQLRAKQSAKRMYGVLERQFRNYVNKAVNSKGNPIDNLLSLLERRLDNVIYRLGWAKTRPAARQLVGHGQIRVNGVKMNIPSYSVLINDEIELSDKMADNPQILALESENIKIPDWLSLQNQVAKVVSEPITAEINEPLPISDIIEFYSR